METKPYLLGETYLNPSDRAEIMGGRAYKIERGDEAAVIRVRFVVVGQTRGGVPIVACERDNGRDALGQPLWTHYDPPARIAAALMARIMREAE